MIFTRPIFLITMCALALLSTSNFIIGIHICGKNLDTVSFLSHANNCQNKETNSSCSCGATKSEHCCNNEAIIHQASDSIFSPTYIHYKSPTAVGIDHSTIAVSEIVPTHQRLFAEHFNYDPPPLSRDLALIFLTLLI